MRCAEKIILELHEPRLDEIKHKNFERRRVNLGLENFNIIFDYITQEIEIICTINSEDYYSVKILIKINFIH